jgi:peptidyl-tRNA hydrolase, PTH2 family
MAIKLIMVVRTDLGIGRGKLAAQVAHAAVAATLAGLGGPDLAQWLREGQPKVVLKVPGEPDLREVADQARQAGLPVEEICDAGRTQVSAGTLTCCAVGPADAARIDAVTGGLSLL